MVEVRADDPGDLGRLFHGQEMAGARNGDQAALRQTQTLSGFFRHRKQGRVCLLATDNHGRTRDPAQRGVQVLKRSPGKDVGLDRDRALEPNGAVRQVGQSRG